MMDYDAVSRNPDEYSGKNVRITGKIEQVSEAGNGNVVYLVSTNSISGDIVYVTYKRGSGEERLLVGDIVAMYGECGGVITYKSTLGTGVTVPCIQMKYYELK